MNDLMLREVNANRERPYVFKKRKLFKSDEQKSEIKTLETRPLISNYLDSDNSDDEIILHDVGQLSKVQEGNENYQLRKVNKSHVNGRASSFGQCSDPLQQCELLDYKIEKGDTLQSISIKYRCSISDLKRANKLISDQEFFALKNIKIPVKKYSLLTEILPPVHLSRKNSTIVEEERSIEVINIGIGGRSPSPKDAAAFFKRMDEDLVNIMLSTQSQNDSLEINSTALTEPRIHPLVKVEDGIQWNYLIVCAIVFAIIIPTLIALYLYIRSSHSHSQDIYSNMSHNDSFNPVLKLNIKAKS